MEWINVKESLPKYEQTVLILNDEDVTFGIRTHTNVNGENWRITDMRVAVLDSHIKVEYWMPLPEKPNL